MREFDIGPKIGGKKQRPLGIPCFEDQVTQLAVKRMLERIHEADFPEYSYGYRLGHTPYQAAARLKRQRSRLLQGALLRQAKRRLAGLMRIAQSCCSCAPAGPQGSTSEDA